MSHSSDTLAQFAEQVVSVHTNRISSETRVTEGGEGGYVERSEMACDVRRYDPDTGLPWVLSGHKFILVVSYDVAGNETGAMVGGLNGQPPVKNQPDPATVEAPKHPAERLKEYCDTTYGAGKWRIIENVQGEISGPKIEITAGTETRTAILVGTAQKVIEVPA